MTCCHDSQTTVLLIFFLSELTALQLQMELLLTLGSLVLPWVCSLLGVKQV